MDCASGHTWNGCICTSCGETRDRDHYWDNCKGVCTRCGKTRPPQHDAGYEQAKAYLVGGRVSARPKATKYKEITTNYTCQRCGKKNPAHPE